MGNNEKSLAPAGKEIDAIYGDFALRNTRSTAVVAQPLAIRGSRRPALGKSLQRGPERKTATGDQQGDDGCRQQRNAREEQEITHRAAHSGCKTGD